MRPSIYPSQRYWLGPLILFPDPICVLWICIHPWRFALSLSLFRFCLFDFNLLHHFALFLFTPTISIDRLLLRIFFPLLYISRYYLLLLFYILLCHLPSTFVFSWNSLFLIFHFFSFSYLFDSFSLHFSCRDFFLLLHIPIFQSAFFCRHEKEVIILCWKIPYIFLWNNSFTWCSTASRTENCGKFAFHQFFMI